MCFWPIWHSYLWILHRCFHTTLLSSLLAYFPSIQPPSIPSPLFSSALLSCVLFSCIWVPPLHLLSLLSHLRLGSPASCPIPARPVSACSDEGRLCVGGGCGYFTVPLTFSTFLLLPHSRVWVSDLPRWAATKFNIIVLCCHKKGMHCWTLKCMNVCTCVRN